MDEQLFLRMLQEGKMTAGDLLQETPADEVDGIIKILLRHLPRDEVRRALYARIAGAPLADFEILRMVYFKHCEHATAIGSASRRTVLP